MKKTKLIPFILAVLLLLTACTPGNSERGKELGYFNYPGLDWGMTEEEFFAVMEKNESDFVKNEISGFVEYSLSGITAFGKTSEQIVFRFSKVNEAAEFRLGSVLILYADRPDLSVSLEKLQSDLNSQGVSYHKEELMYSRDNSDFEKVKNTESLLEEDGSIIVTTSFVADKKVRDLAIELLNEAEKGFALENTSHGSTLLDLYGFMPLSKMTVTYIANVKDKKPEKEQIVVQMNGTIGAIMSYADLA